MQVLDRRSGARIGSGGAIERGSRPFGAPGARFAAADVGAFLGIRGANPQGVCYVGRIQRIVSPTEVELDLPAHTTVRGADYAYGGACREGLRLFHGTSVSLEGCRIEAGVQSGLPGEPPGGGDQDRECPRSGGDRRLGRRRAARRGAGGRSDPAGIVLAGGSRLASSPDRSGFKREGLLAAS